MSGTPRDAPDLALGYAELARRAALGDAPAAVAALEAIADPLETIATTLRRHQMADTVLAALRREAPGRAERLAREIGRGQRRSPPGPGGLLSAYADLQAQLQTLGVPVLLLKGATLAERLWGGLERRSQHDLDVLVTHAHRSVARRTLVNHGYRVRHRDQHAVTLRRGSTLVDLHWTLRSAPAYRIDETDTWRSAVSITVAGLPVRTLGDQALLALLAVSAVEDVGQGNVKLKQLCDLWLLAREIDDTADWDRWLHGRLGRMTASGCALALALLDQGGDAPRLAAALAGRDDLRIPDRTVAARLITTPRDAAFNDAWFADAYPGSVLGFRAHSLYSGLPASLRDARPGRYLLPRAAARG